MRYYILLFFIFFSLIGLNANNNNNLSYNREFNQCVIKDAQLKHLVDSISNNVGLQPDKCSWVLTFQRYEGNLILMICNIDGPRDFDKCFTKSNVHSFYGLVVQNNQYFYITYINDLQDVEAFLRKTDGIIIVPDSEEVPEGTFPVYAPNRGFIYSNNKFVRITQSFFNKGRK